MASESGGWRTARLSECATFQEGYVNPSQLVAEYFGDDVKWLRAVDLNDSFVFETSRRLSRAGFESAGKSALLFEPNTLAISKSGTIGRLGILKDRMCGNRAVINIRVDQTRCDSRFIFYSLLLRRREIEELAGGSVQKNLYCSALGTVEIDLPPLYEQLAIARVLGTLDDKIELNRRMNETLEAMAHALFKSWFVDFDPVRAKAEGRDPGLPKLLADLFPDSFENSELGEIPTGWDFRPLRELAGYLSRGLGPTYVDVGGVCVLNQKCIREHRVDFSKARRHDSGGRPVEGRMLRPLDILVNSTGVGTLGRIAQVWRLPEPSVVDSHVTIVRAAANVDPWFLGIALVQREADVESLGEGSTGQTELSRTRLGELTCLVPPLALQGSFGRLVGPMLSRLSANERASTSAATARDTLLPRLISGQLSVKGVERMLAEASRQ
jgi:type I restriction enzyme S subunit